MRGCIINHPASFGAYEIDRNAKFLLALTYIKDCISLTDYRIGLFTWAILRVWGKGGMNRKVSSGETKRENWERAGK